MTFALNPVSREYPEKEFKIVKSVHNSRNRHRSIIGLNRSDPFYNQALSI